jgi:hypothetical protein
MDPGTEIFDYGTFVSFFQMLDIKAGSDGVQVTFRKPCFSCDKLVLSRCQPQPVQTKQPQFPRPFWVHRICEKVPKV